MKITSTKLVMITALLAAAVLAIRLAWVASGTETGWETLGQSLQTATLGQVGSNRLPLALDKPSEQADFWLGEVDRIFDDQRQSASACMGAALILDQPDTLYRYSDPWESLLLTESVVILQTICSDEEHGDVFEAKCFSRCLELAAMATEFDPGNVAWWRMRALLLFSERGPRSSDWLAVLDECARHDPDNALYDYLAALRLLQSSSSHDYEDGEVVVVVEDSRQFADGCNRFQRGLQKKQLMLLTSAASAKMDFLRTAALPSMEEVGIVENEVLARKSLSLVRGLHWQSWRPSPSAEDSGKVAGALALWERRRRLLDQIAPADNLHFARYAARASVLESIWGLLTLAQEYPEQYSGKQLADLRARQISLSVDNKALEEASERLDAELLANRSPGLIRAKLVMLAALAMAVALLLSGVICWLAGRWLGGSLDEGPTLGLLRHAIAWLLALGATFTLLGIFPSGIVVCHVPGAFTGWLIFTLATGLLLMLFRKFLELCRGWSTQSGTLRVIAMIGVVTLWQAVLIMLMSAGRSVWSPAGLFVMIKSGSLLVIVILGLLFVARLLLTRRFTIAQFATAIIVLLLASISALVAFTVAGIQVMIKSGSLLVIAILGLLFVVRLLLTRRYTVAQFATAVILLLLASIPAAEAFAVCPDSLAEFFELDSLGWGDVSASDFRWLFGAADSPCLWAVLQWCVHAGIYASPLAALLTVTLWHMVRRGRISREGVLRYWVPPSRARWGGLLSCVGRSAMGAAICCLLVYLAIAPTVTRGLETVYQTRIANASDSQSYWSKKVDRASAQIRSDAAAMKLIRDEVVEKIRWAEEDQAELDQIEEFDEAEENQE